MTVHESAGRDFCLYMREGDAPRQANAEVLRILMSALFVVCLCSKMLARQLALIEWH